MNAFKLIEKWEVAFLAKGGRLSRNEKLIVKDFARWLDFEAAQQSAQADICAHEWLASTLPGIDAVCSLCGEKSPRIEYV